VNGIYWSLPLAHLRYYGDPVTISRSTGHDGSRVSINGIVLVALGAALSTWVKSASELNKALHWFVTLSESLHRIAANEEEEKSARDGASMALQRPGWLSCLTSAAVSFLDSSDADREMEMKLIKLGHRRHGEFLAKPIHHPSCKFGLSDPIVLIPLLTHEEERVRLLRRVAEGLCEKQDNMIKRDELIIRYGTQVSDQR